MSSTSDNNINYCYSDLLSNRFALNSHTLCNAIN